MRERAYTTSTFENFPKRGVDFLGIYTHLVLRKTPPEIFFVISKDEIRAWIRDTPIDILHALKAGTNFEFSVICRLLACLCEKNDGRFIEITKIIDKTEVWNTCIFATEKFEQSKDSHLYVWFKTSSNKPYGYWLTLKNLIRLSSLLGYNYDGCEKRCWFLGLDQPEHRAPVTAIWQYSKDIIGLDLYFIKFDGCDHRVTNIFEIRKDISNVVEEVLRSDKANAFNNALEHLKKGDGLDGW